MASAIFYKHLSSTHVLDLISRRRLKESFDVDLQGADGVLQFVVLQHRRVQDTEGTNHVVLAGYAHVNGSGVAGEVCGL